MKWLCSPLVLVAQWIEHSPGVWEVMGPVMGWVRFLSGICSTLVSCWWIQLETGNDCDVISVLKVPGKRDFSDILLFSYINNALLYHFSANWLAHNKKVTEITSQSFPVSCFWSHGFVPHRKWNFKFLVRQNTGQENRYGIICFAILISALERFYRANTEKKICHIHLKKCRKRRSFFWISILLRVLLVE